MQKFLIFLFVFNISSGLKAQVHIAPDTIHFTNVPGTQVKKLGSDSLSSTFLIRIVTEVKPHYHANHTENVIVVKGSGIMKLGEKIINIKKGDIIIIPKGTVHSVISTGKKALKVISIQSPFFDGKDRVMMD
ncbi:MAG: cupin domain-containing protein [Bacteroidia bacterium]